VFFFFFLKKTHGQNFIFSWLQKFITPQVLFGL